MGLLVDRFSSYSKQPIDYLSIEVPPPVIHAQPHRAIRGRGIDELGMEKLVEFELRHYSSGAAGHWRRPGNSVNDCQDL
jgi:hypothetical protein